MTMHLHLKKETALGAEIHYECWWESNVLREKLWRELNGEATEVKYDRQKVMWSERSAQTHAAGMTRAMRVGKPDGYVMVESPLPVE
jgi:hypothetical protein